MNSLKVHKAGSKANIWIVMSIWFFLIVLPFIVIAGFSRNFIKDKELKHLEEVKQELLQEYTSFKNNLTFTNYLTYLIEANKNLFSNTNDLDKLCYDFEIKNKIPISIALLYNREKNLVSTFIHKELRINNPLTSKRILNDYMSCLTEENYVEKGEVNENGKFNRASSYFSKVFKLSSSLVPKVRQGENIISGYDELGKLITAFIPIKKGNLSGYDGLIIFVREKDISLQTIMKYAQNKKNNPSLIRDYKYVENYGFDKENGIKEYEFITEPDESISLFGYPNDDFLVRIINKGTFYPFNIDEIYEKPLMLKVSAQKSYLSHPFRNFAQKAKKPIALFISIITFCLLNILIFGYGNGTNIITRLTVSIIVSSVIPFTIFAFTVLLQNEYEKVNEEIQFVNTADLAESNIHIALNDFFKRKEKLIANINSRIINMSFQNLSAFFKDEIRTINASCIGIFKDKNKDNYNYIENPNIKDNKPKQIEREMIIFLYNVFRNVYKTTPVSKKVNPNEDWDIRYRKSGVNPENFEDVFKLEGALKSISSFSQSRIYNISPILKPNSPNASFNEMSLSSTIVYIFNNSELINEFIKNNKHATDKGKYEDYEVNYCFIPLEKKGELPGAEKFLYSSQGIEKNNIEKIIQNMGSSFSDQKIKSENSIISANVYNNFNIIVITQLTKKHSNTNYTNYILYGIASYYIIILIAIIYFLQTYFVKPVKLLERAANLVKEGKYNIKIVYQSGDEFEALTNAFNDMAQGIHQKERLAKYVNVSVLEEIENKNSNTTMKPGGERINASIVFISLGGFDDYKQKHNAEEIAKTLGDLVDKTDEIAKKYNGLTDKLIEDTLMVVFRQQNENDIEYPLNACKTALEISNSYSESQFELHIGIASGSVVSGKIGSKTGKLDFTVIGNPVNLAARLKVQAHKAKETGILLCPTTIRLLKGKGKLKFIERTPIKGRTRTFPLYELIKLRT